MAIKVADRVQETTTTTGTGTVTLAGAATGYRAFSAAFTVGDEVYYAIELGSEWEVGIGTLATSTTLSRDTVLDSSNAGALVNFSAGTKKVWSNAPARLFNLGKVAIPIPATVLTPRSANGCASLAQSNGAANQPDVQYLAFDGAAKEFAGFTFQLPTSWDGGTVTAKFSWRRASGTGAADVVWGIRAVAVSDNESPAVNFGSDATVTDDAKTTTANFSLSGETAVCTIGNSPVAGDLVFFEVFRDGAHASDTLDAVDAWLSMVTLFLGTVKANDE